MVLQACKPLDAMQRIRGIRPGARILLHVEGERRVRIVLTQIDTIEALGIDPIDVSPSYWQTLGNRLAAGLTDTELTQLSGMRRGSPRESGCEPRRASSLHCTAARLSPGLVLLT